MMEPAGGPAFTFPPELAEYDPARWPSRAHWHLRRAYALPRRMRREKVAELRAACAAS